MFETLNQLNKILWKELNLHIYIVERLNSNFYYKLKTKKIFNPYMLYAFINEEKIPKIIDFQLMSHISRNVIYLMRE